MKSHRQLSARQEALAERNLFAAISSLRSVDECRAFFRDLCTPAELQAMADRWAVVDCLRRGLPSRKFPRQPGPALPPSATMAGAGEPGKAGSGRRRDGWIERAMDTEG